MGKSAKLTRLGNFATHKKNVRSRVLIDKRKKPVQTSAKQPNDKATKTTTRKAAITK